MIFYNVYDGDETDRWFTTKREAVAYAREVNDGLDKNDFLAAVRRVDIGKPTKEQICRCLQGEGFARSSEQVWP